MRLGKYFTTTPCKIQSSAPWGPVVTAGAPCHQQATPNAQLCLAAEQALPVFSHYSGAVAGTGAHQLAMSKGSLERLPFHRLDDRGGCVVEAHRRAAALWPWTFQALGT